MPNKLLDIEGLKFGKLTAIERLDSIFVGKDNNKKFQWKFLCECGCEYITVGSYVKRGRIKSCGCDKNRKDKNGNWQGFGDISGSVLGHYKKNANKRGIDFDVDIEYLNEIYHKQNKKCVYSGIKLVMERKGVYCRTTINASLDRIDSNKGYIKGNIQWVYMPINNMKGALSHEEFVNLCGTIYKNNKTEPLSGDILKSRNICCGNGCLNCPYDYVNVEEPKKSELLKKRQ